ncbi:MAG: AAA family ATPase [Bacteroidetes bacterium RIFCSPLOWO2_12_FULL_37_12]|nr:MAG: AAA family ATPase [Bacteroidetes bacterium RIFCSPLOWO2_12_FULL_37_12]
MSSLIPLAERIRPESLDRIAGQKHLVGPGKPLRIALERKNVHSMIFWGPPGVGKTTLARIIAKTANRPFFQISAINAGVKDIRNVFEKITPDSKPVLFIDEIHRFNKSQQDALLGVVEKGDIILIGATTENPSFEVISALLSRCQVYILEPLGKDELIQLAEFACANDESLSKHQIILKENSALLRLSGGDARKLLNLLEIIVEGETGKHVLTVSSEKGVGEREPKIEILIDDKLVMHYATQKLAMYDKNGEYHYDIISALIKSMRGSDPNGAVYWLARMIEGGEDPLFIARRMIIFSSEDIGNANPNALLLATSCFEAVNKIGYPEARIILSQTAVYLASSPKSNASYMAIEKAIEKVKEKGDLPVPLHIRNAPTKLMKEIGYGKNYQYDHSREGNFAGQEFLPEGLEKTVFYEPGEMGSEKAIRERLVALWKGKYYK